MTMSAGDWVVVGIDNGGNKNSATVLDSEGHFLVEQFKPWYERRRAGGS